MLNARWTAVEDLLTFEIEANAFCHQMVRSLVAMCVEVGKGNRTVDDVAEILQKPGPQLCCWNRPSPRSQAGLMSAMKATVGTPERP